MMRAWDVLGDVSAIQRAVITVESASTAAGAAIGTTVVDATLTTQPSYQGQTLKILSGDAVGQVRPIALHAAGGNTLTVIDPFTDVAGAVVQIVAGTRYMILTPAGGGGAGATNLLLPHFFEAWQDLAIDPSLWTVTDPATGAAWAAAVAGDYIYNTTIPNANETARLVGDQLWIVPSHAIPLRIVMQRLIIEFELNLANVANIDNTLFFVGLTPGVANTRASNNIIGFGLLADVLQTITDLAGVETVNTAFGETLAQHNKFRMEISDTEVQFYLNEVLLATHAANIPAVPSYLNFFIDTEGGGAATFSVQIVRGHYEDFAR